MKKSLIHSQKGMTLMEMIVAIALMGIVLTAIFRFLFFGVDSFQFGIEQIDHQSALRTATFELVNEVRNVRHVKLLPGSSSPTMEEYIMVSSNRLLHHSDTAGTDSYFSQDTIQSVEFSLSPSNDIGLLTVTLTSLDGESLSTEVLLNNIDVSATSTGEIIEFDFNP